MIDSITVLKKIPESSAGVKLCLIAEGKTEINIHTNSRGSKWDTCAPQVILEEAGGRLTDHKGNLLDYKQKELAWVDGFVGTNSLLHEEVISFIKNHSL